METYLPDMTIIGVLAFLAPLGVAIVLRPSWSPAMRRNVALVVSVIVALAALLATGNLSWEPKALVQTIFGVIGVSQAAYALIWKPIGVADSVESATSRQGRHVEQDQDNGSQVQEGPQG